MTRSKYITEEFLDKRLDKFKGELKEELVQIKVEIVGEIKNMRENEDVHSYSHIRVNDELIDHAKRLKVLETS